LGIDDQPEAVPDERLVVGDEHGDGHSAAANGRVRVHQVAAARQRPRGEVAAVEGGTFPHPDEPASLAGVGRGGSAAATVIGDHQFEFAFPISDAHGRVRRSCVLDDVGERLLGDAVRDEVQPGRQRHWFALDVDFNQDAGNRDLVDEGVEASQAGLRREFGRVVFIAEKVEKAAQLTHGLATGAFDGQQELFGRVRRRTKDLPCRATVQHDHAGGVGEDVMQFPSDASPLLCGSDPCPLVSFSLKVEGALLESDNPFGATAQNIADQPGDREEQERAHGVGDPQITQCGVRHQHGGEHHQSGHRSESPHSGFGMSSHRVQRQQGRDDGGERHAPGAMFSRPHEHEPGDHRGQDRHRCRAAPQQWKGYEQRTECLHKMGTASGRGPVPGLGDPQCRQRDRNRPVGQTAECHLGQKGLPHLHIPTVNLGRLRLRRSGARSPGPAHPPG
jgi:hypothetical protein